MTQYTVPDAWRIPEMALRLSFDEMARDGQQQREGVALWLGQRQGATSAVTHVVALRGPGIVKRFDVLHISADLVNDVSDLAIDRGVTLIGQIHSHAPGYGVELSIADRTLGVIVPGYLSAVAPNFALDPLTRVSDVGFHVFERPDGWRRLDRHEIKSRIDTTNSHVEFLLAGERQ